MPDPARGQTDAGETHVGETHAGEVQAGEDTSPAGTAAERGAGTGAATTGPSPTGAATTGADPTGTGRIGAVATGAGAHGRPLWRTVLMPRWTGLLVLALAIAAVMSVMGVWQIGVYQSKTADATAERAAAPPVELQSLFSIDEGLPSKAVGRRVTISGTWAPAADQVFIADRLHDGRDGFWVVSPLKLSETDAVMVVRGWVASVTDPAAAAPSGAVSLTGSVISSEAEDASGDAAKGRVLSSLRIPTIVHLVKYRLYDAFVVQASVESGVVPAPAPAAVTPPPPPTDHAGLRNIAYAFQWWIFAAFTLWMWARMVLDAHRDPTDPSDTDPSDPTPADTDPADADPAGVPGPGESHTTGPRTAELL